jgi:hypothetical protein
MSAAHRRQTILLRDLDTGWVFRLHREAMRVWADSASTDAPVPLAFLAGLRASEFEAEIGASWDLSDMTATAKKILPPRIEVLPAAQPVEA